MWSVRGGQEQYLNPMLLYGTVCTPTHLPTYVCEQVTGKTELEREVERVAVW